VVIKKHILKDSLKRGVETGTLVQVKNSYKVSAEAKKPPKVKKAAAAAKTAPKKKVRIDDQPASEREPLSMLIHSLCFRARVCSRTGYGHEKGKWMRSKRTIDRANHSFNQDCLTHPSCALHSLYLSDCPQEEGHCREKGSCQESYYG
jgi:hypothetical protein